MRAEQVDTRFLGAQVGFEADEDKWGVRAEMEDFRVPLVAKLA